MKYVLSAVLAAFILTGCGEDEVELVKNYTLPDFKSMSIGTAIEGSKICKSVTWSKEENGGLKMVKMVCDVDMENMKARAEESRLERLKPFKQDALDISLKGTMAFYEGKTYDTQSLLKLANEHCKLNETKFQETLKTKGKIEFDDEEKLVDCNIKLEETLKEDSTKSSIDYIIRYLKKAVYYSQITIEQYDVAQFGQKKVENGPSKATIELNFVLNADKSISLSDKFKLTTDGIEDPRSGIQSKDIITNFYERQ